MSGKKLDRRDFLRAAAMAAVGLAAASCTQPTPQVIEKPVTVVVEKEVPVEKQVLATVVVEKEIPVEKVVQQTVVVEKEKLVKETVVVKETVSVEKVVTATPVPSKYHESPKLAELVKAGKLPPVEERLPVEPLVVQTVEQTGQYGGIWHRLAVGPGDLQLSGRLTYENLVRQNIDGSELVPNVATSWEMSSDGMSYTFNLVKGIKWSDGEPFGADDYVYYYQDHLSNKELVSGFPQWLASGGKPSTLDKIDDYTIRINFEVPNGLFLLVCAYGDALDMQRYPAHYLKQFHPTYVDKAKLEAMAKAEGFDQWFQLYNSKHNVETNPDHPTINAWNVSEPAPAQPIAAERNPYYWKVDPEGNQLPYIDRIEFMVVEKSDVVNMRAVAGDVDMQLRNLTFDNYPLFKENEAKGDYRTLDWQWGDHETILEIMIDSADPVKNPILGDKRFRYALSLGMDRQEICDSIYLGTTEPSQAGPTPGPYHWEEYSKNKIEHDPDQANAYLDEMGLTNRDAAGYRLMPDGNRLTIFYEHCGLFGAWGPIGELLTQQYKAIGIDLQVKEMGRDLFYERFQARQTDIGIWTGAFDVNPMLNPSLYLPYKRSAAKWAPDYALWHESGGKKGTEPPPGSDVRKVIDIWDHLVTTVTQEEHVQLFHQILEIAMDNMWTIGVCTPPIQPVIVKNNFRNVPEKAISTYGLLSPGATAPEQYFIRQA